VSSLRLGDEDLHYSDSSHRWLCPIWDADERMQDAWSDRVRAHMEEHRALIGGQAQQRRPNSTRHTPTV
jgi:hypothetical protein